MEFVAIDVETANADMASICQIGIARFSNGRLVSEWSSLIDPADYFSPVNVSIHGINADMVAGEPTFSEVCSQIRDMLEGMVAVCHTHFDRVALAKAFAKWNLPPLETRWLDSARVARRAWEDVAWAGYGLGNICRRIGYSFKHHDALEDAKAAGHVLLAACTEMRQDIDYWLRRVEQPINRTPGGYSSVIRRNGNPDGDLFGEVLAFTGQLQIPRSHAAEMAAMVGCEVVDGVTKRTTILVVGDQDIKKLAGHDKSSKHRKAEKLAAGGQVIRILCESDFQSLVHTTVSRNQ